MNLEKIKESARKFEQAQDWRRAIEVYQKAIQEFESGQDPTPDVGVYNKVGDLHLKANEPSAAVQVFERAVDLYTDQGFYNNAIALCGKVLRVNPGRVQVYLKLAQLHARKNVVIDAKKNLVEYLERMNAFQKLEEAAEACKRFGEQFGDNADLRELVAGLLNAAAADQPGNAKLQQMAADFSNPEARASTMTRRPSRASIAVPKAKAGDLIFLDVEDEEEEEAPPPPPKPAVPPKPATPPKAAAPAAPAPPPPAPAPAPEPEAPLAIERTSLVDESAPPVIDEPALEIEPTSFGEVALPEELEQAPELEPLVEMPMSDEIVPADIPLVEDVVAEGLDLEVAPELEVALPEEEPEPTGPVLRATGELNALADSTFEPETFDTPAVEVPAEEELVTFEPEPALSFIESEAPAAPTVEELEGRILDDPENPEHHRALGEALLASGETQRGHEELELAMDRYEAVEDWPHALDVANELIRLDPAGVRHYQKRVELAFRLGDREYLIESYLELGDALLRSGAVDKAVAVYRRVVDHDPQNERAATALRTLAGDEPAPAAPPPPPAAKAKPQAPPPAAPATPAAPPPPRGSRPVPVASDGFVDLGSFIMEDEEREADTRMRIEEEEPSGDEERDFSSMLSAFKQG
ncbi:MAG TPA: tetratricopeptide repeat protein, partial [Gemmatimonadales bacterium]|nr:tetratricopeptide repeat protein [Gemmatimonadales bacterium]